MPAPKPPAMACVWISSLGWLALALLLSATASAQSTPKPNIIVILANVFVAAQFRKRPSRAVVTSLLAAVILLAASASFSKLIDLNMLVMKGDGNAPRLSFVLCSMLPITNSRELFQPWLRRA